jgi:biotin transport system substrate-specific component
MYTTRQPVLLDALMDTPNGWMKSIACVCVGSMLLTLSAKFQVPFYPVPMTLQTLVVLLLGVVLGWRLGSLTVLFYLAQGASGLPVFAGTPEKGLGLIYMAGPTGGYLMGFVLAAALTGWLAERGFDRSRLGMAAAMVGGNAVIYALGLLWLGSFIGYNQQLIGIGMMPFVLGDLLKIALAVVTVPLLWRVLRRRTPE